MRFKFDVTKLGGWYDMKNVDWQKSYAGMQKFMTDSFSSFEFMKGQERLPAQMARLIPTDVIFLHLTTECANALAHHISINLQDYVKQTKNQGLIKQTKDTRGRERFVVNTDMVQDLKQNGEFHRHADFLVEKLGRKSLKEFNKYYNINVDNLAFDSQFVRSENTNEYELVQNILLDNGARSRIKKSQADMLLGFVKVDYFLNRDKDSMGLSPLQVNEVDENAWQKLLTTDKKFNSLGWVLDFDMPSADEIINEWKQDQDTDKFVKQITLQDISWTLVSLKSHDQQKYKIDCSATSRLQQGAITDNSFLRSNIIASCNYTDSVCEKVRQNYQHMIPYYACLTKEANKTNPDKIPLREATFDKTKGNIAGHQDWVITVENVNEGSFVPKADQRKTKGIVGLYRSAMASDEPYVFVSSGNNNPTQTLKLWGQLLNTSLPYVRGDLNATFEKRKEMVVARLPDFQKDLMSGFLNHSPSVSQRGFSRHFIGGSYTPLFPYLTEALNNGSMHKKEAGLEQTQEQQKGLENLQDLMKTHILLSSDRVSDKHTLIKNKLGVTVVNGVVQEKPVLFKDVDVANQDGEFIYFPQKNGNPNHQDNAKLQPHIPVNIGNKQEISIIRTAGALSNVGYQIEQLIGANHTYFQRKYQKDKNYTLEIEGKRVNFSLPNPLKVVGGQAITHLAENNLSLRPTRELLGAYKITESDYGYQVQHQIGLVSKELFGFIDDNFANNDRLMSAFPENISPKEYVDALSDQYSPMSRHQALRKRASEGLIIARVAFDCYGDTLPSDDDFKKYQSGQRYQNDVRDDGSIGISKLTLKNTKPLGSVTPVVENVRANGANVVLLGEGLDTMQTVAFTLGADDKSRGVAIYACHDANNLKHIAKIMADSNNDPKIKDELALRTDNTVVRIMADNDWVYRGLNAEDEVTEYIKLMNVHNVPLEQYSNFYDVVSLATQKGEQAQYPVYNEQGQIMRTALIEPMRRGDNILFNTGYLASEQAKKTLQDAGFDVEVIHPPQPMLETLRVARTDPNTNQIIYSHRDPSRPHKAEFTDFADLFQAQAGLEYQKIFDGLPDINQKRALAVTLRNHKGLAPTTDDINHENAFALAMYDRTRKNLNQGTSYSVYIPYEQNGQLYYGSQKMNFSLVSALNIPKHINVKDNRSENGYTTKAVGEFLSPEEQKKFDERLSLSLGSFGSNLDKKINITHLMDERIKGIDVANLIHPSLQFATNAVYPKAVLDPNSKDFISKGANLNAHLTHHEINQNALDGEDIYSHGHLPNRSVIEDASLSTGLSEKEVLNVWTQLVKPSTLQAIPDKSIDLIWGTVFVANYAKNDPTKDEISLYHQKVNRNKSLEKEISQGKINTYNMTFKSLGQQDDILLKEYILSLKRDNPSDPAYQLPQYEASGEIVRPTKEVQKEIAQRFILNSKMIDEVVRHKLIQDHAKFFVENDRKHQGDPNEPPYVPNNVQGFDRKESAYIKHLAQRYKEGQEPAISIYDEFKKGTKLQDLAQKQEQDNKKNNFSSPSLTF